jgi:hypothetical protein
MYTDAAVGNCSGALISSVPTLRVYVYVYLSLSNATETAQLRSNCSYTVSLLAR